MDTDIVPSLYILHGQDRIFVPNNSFYTTTSQPEGQRMLIALIDSESASTICHAEVDSPGAWGAILTHGIDIGRERFQ